MDICVPGNRLEMNGARALTLVLARTQLTQLDLSCTCLLITHLAEYSGWLLKSILIEIAQRADTKSVWMHS